MAYGGHSGTIYGYLGVTVRGHLDTLGWLWHHFGVTLGSCCGHCGHLEVLLGHTGAFLKHFGITLGLLWVRLGATVHMNVASGHFAVALGLL